jgi:ABC-type multidrug transport system fused ATPase/permease subunit
MRNNSQYLQQIGLAKYNPSLVYKNDLEDTIARLNASKYAPIDNIAKKWNLILAGALFGLFIIFLIFFLLSTKGWAIFWIILAVLCILAAVFFVVYAFILTKSKHEKQLQDRRDQIRNYLRSENERYYHRRGLHWKPSRECSYLILKLGFAG